MEQTLIIPGKIAAALEQINDQTKTTELPWLKWAEGELGVKRAKSGDEPRILEYWKIFKMGGIQNQRVSWCSAFIGAALESVGINSNSTPDVYKIRTKDSSQYWLHWTHGTKLEKPCYGCIGVMTRNGGGHVGFVIGEDLTNYILLGGNQGSAVSISKYPKSRFNGFIMPTGNWPKEQIPVYSGNDIPSDLSTI